MVSVVFNKILLMATCLCVFSIVAPTVSDIAKNIRAGNFVDAVQVAVDVSPYEFAALVSGISLTSATMYIKAYVPWRHRQ